MARLISSERSMVLGIDLQTVFEDGSVVDHSFKTGDVVENLRYVKDGAIETISGKIVNIDYTMASKLTWNKNNPSDTLPNDMVINSITVDASTQYESNLVLVPAREILEWDGEENVKRMVFKPFISYIMKMNYSNRTSQTANIQVGDTFNSVRIMVPTDIGNDITGEFSILAFAYKVESKKAVITGIAFKNVETGQVVVADLDYILALNEIFTFDVTDSTGFLAVLNDVADGDTVLISSDLDLTDGNVVSVTGKSLVLDTGSADITCSSSATSGVDISSGAKVTITGSGKFVTTTPYDSSHSTGIVRVRSGGEVVFNGGGVNAVIDENPVDNGQFGVTVYDDSKLTVNNGDFRAGWYAISGNGTSRTPDGLITINGGVFVSTTDYAIYHPQAGKLVINDGLIDGAAGALAVNNGTIEINGGTFQTNGTGNTGEWSDGTSGLGNACLNLNGKYGPVNCTITGGRFKTSGEAIMIATGSKNPVTLSISGGEFSSKPEDEWLAPGCTVSSTPNADGFYVVRKA